MTPKEIEAYRITYDKDYWTKHIHEVNQYGLRTIFVAACHAINTLVDEIERSNNASV